MYSRVLVPSIVFASLALVPLGVHAEEGDSTGAAKAVTPTSGTPLPVVFAPSVQERARFNYVSDKTFDGDLDSDWSIGNRARLGLRATVGDRIGGFIQLQDVRNWGSEVNGVTGGEGTLQDWVADGLDIHQAYGELKTSFGLGLRIGRQEINWHGQRLIGASGWTDQARSFDAIRVTFAREAVAGVELMYSKLLERPNTGSENADRANDLHLVALRGGPRLGDRLTLDGLGILRVDPASEETMMTLGVHAKGKASILSYEAEGYAQVGTAGDADILAFLVGFRVGANLDLAKGTYIGGGLDLVSGDDDRTDATIKSFDTLYAANHRFYGHMDLYLALPSDTGGKGLVDGQVNFKIKPADPVTVKLDAHVFAAAAPSDSDHAFHGVEVDVEAAVELVKPLTVGVGLWAYVPGSFWGEDPKAELGAYLMTDFRFQ